MIMLRLQRVTFLALHDYLGLSEELINPNVATSLTRVNSRSSMTRTSVSSDDSSGFPAKRASLPGIYTAIFKRYFFGKLILKLLMIWTSNLDRLQVVLMARARQCTAGKIELHFDFKIEPIF